MKVLIADDHALFREGLRHALADLRDGMRILEAGDFGEALALAEEHPDLDLALIDLAMPGMDGFAGLEALGGRLPQTPLVVVSASDDPRDVLQAIEAGASGYVPKTLDTKVMLGALHLVLSGGRYLPPELLGTLNEAPHRESTETVSAAVEEAPLTPRQLDVLGLLALGKSNKEVARALGLSEGTVKLHVTALLKALHANNRTQAVIKASDMGLIPARSGAS